MSISNLVLFKRQISSVENHSVQVYLRLYKEKILTSPLIFTDEDNVFIHNLIPIFHTYYIRQHFHKKYILLDMEDEKHVPESIDESQLLILHHDLIYDNDLIQKLQEATNVKLC